MVREGNELKIARRAALVAMLLLLVASLALARVASAAAAPAPTLNVHPVFVEEDEDEAEELEDEAGDSDEEGEEDDVCASDDEAKEEACEERLEAEEEAEELAGECRLAAAEATVATVPGRDEVRLTVSYRTVQPSSVAVEMRLRGSHGALDLGTESAHFVRSGTLHAAKLLSDSEMERAAAAKEFTVGVHAVNSPRFCRAIFERHLTAHHGGRWSDPTAARRAREAARLF